MKKGIFITFEGTEGSGKSTLIRGLSEALRRKKISHLCTREPGGNPIAEAIREILLKDFKKDKMHARTELFLYEAARIEHLEKVVLPALRSGKIVLCDRFTDSTLAYQAHARGLNWSVVESLNHSATNGVAPHLTFLLKIDPAQGLRRASNPNRFEKEGLLFQKKVLQGFLKARKKSPRRWAVLDVEAFSKTALVTEALCLIEKKGWI